MFIQSEHWPRHASATMSSRASTGALMNRNSVLALMRWACLLIYDKRHARVGLQAYGNAGTAKNTNIER